MRRHKFKAVADDDSLPVIVPRNDKVAVPISRERVRCLRKHLIVTLRALRMTKIQSIPYRLCGRNQRVLQPVWRVPLVLCARDGAVRTGRIMPFWIKQRLRVYAAQGCR